MWQLLPRTVRPMGRKVTNYLQIFSLPTKFHEDTTSGAPIEETTPEGTTPQGQIEQTTPEDTTSQAQIGHEARHGGLDVTLVPVEDTRESVWKQCGHRV